LILDSFDDVLSANLMLRRMVRWAGKDVWEETVVAYFKAFSKRLPDRLWRTTDAVSQNSLSLGWNSNPGLPIMKQEC